MKNKENTNAFLIHIAAFSGYIIPFGSVIAPLIVWQTVKGSSAFLDKHGKEAINFNLSFSVYLFLLNLTFIPLVLASFSNNLHNFDFEWGANVFNLFGISSIIGLIGLVKIALIVLAASKANKGETYEYPLTIQFLK